MEEIKNFSNDPAPRHAKAGQQPDSVVYCIHCFLRKREENGNEA